MRKDRYGKVFLGRLNVRKGVFGMKAKCEIYWNKMPSNCQECRAWYMAPCSLDFKCKLMELKQIKCADVSFEFRNGKRHEKCPLEKIEV